MELIARDIGDLRVEVAPSLGGRIHRISYRGVDLLRTPRSIAESRTDPWYWSGFFMAPWCNRIPNGRFAFNSGAYCVPPNFDDGSAIHGQVHRRAWLILEDTNDRPLRWGVSVDDEFPWPYTVEASMWLTTSSLRIRLLLTNTSTTPMPAGLGWHPWFNAQDRLLMRIPARMQFPLSASHGGESAPIPTSGPAVLDSADNAVWGRHELYADIAGEPISLIWPNEGILCRMHVDQSAHVLVYAHEQTRSIAVESQSHALNGFERLAECLPGAIHVLPSGGTLTSTISLTLTHQKED